MTLHTNLANQPYKPLSDDEIRRLAPSIFAGGAHDSRSERYVHIPTTDLLASMRKEGFIPYSAKQAKSRDDDRRGFAKHMLRFRRADAELQNGVSPEVVLINSHDGSTAYKLLAGLIRFACLNGLIVADGNVETVRVPHTGDILGQVIEGSYTVLKSSTAALETQRAWSQLMLTTGEQLAFAEAARALRFGDANGHVDTPISASQLLHEQRHEDVGSDLWRVYNRVQEHVIRGGLSARLPADPARPRHRGRLITSRAVGGIDADVKLNKALWTLAAKLAETKAA